MVRKRFKVSRPMLVIWFTLAGSILLLAPQSLTGKFQSAFNSLFRVPLGAGRSLSLSVAQNQFSGDMVDRQAYDQLNNHLANCQQELAESYQRMEKLYGLYNKYVWPDREFVLAGVYKAALVGRRNEIVIDRGDRHGLLEGQFVLAHNSIIGIVSQVFSSNATVRLITDTSFVAQVQIGQIRGVIKGLGNGQARVIQVSRKNQIKPGDDVFICKIPGALPAAMKVGTVKECKIADNPLLWDITVTPACDLARLEDVAVIIIGTEK